jgi:cytochrome c oxidase subunit 2
MNLQIYRKFRSIFGCLLVVGLLFAGSTYAVQQDTVATDTTAVVATAEDTDAAADTAATEEAASTTEVTETSSSTSSTATVASTAADEGTQIAPQVYKNFFYYVLLFLVICAVVAVIGKIHSVYELTRKMNGTYNPLAGNNLQSIMLFLFLLFFLFGNYYSFSVWGDWAWRDAVTEHGKDYDTMFIVTTVLTTAVMIIMHILILTFTLVYRQRKNRVAYYYPHNDTIEKIWTIVPATVLTILVLFGFFTWRSITNVPEELQKSAIQIER